MSDSGVTHLPRDIPSARGANSAGILAFLDAAKDLELHGLMIYRAGAVVAEGYWKPYAAERPHMLHSAVKSWTGTAIGLAIGDGLLSLDDKILDFFPEHRPAVVSNNLAAMTVRDLLTMRSGHRTGLSGGEWRGSTDSWMAAFLREPVLDRPGEEFIYSSGSSYALSAIVTKTCGRTVHALLEERIFKPMGIPPLSWDISPEGYSSGGNGLSCSVEDMLKFGVLHLHDGIWEGRRLLPEGWVAEATRNQVREAWIAPTDGRRYPSRESIPPETVQKLEGYGYQWWKTRDDGYRATGLFGQHCIVLPHADAVIAITAAMPPKDSPLLKLVWQYLVPALEGKATHPAQDAALAKRLGELHLPMPSGNASSSVVARISGRPFVMEPNEDQVTRMIFDFSEGVCRLTLVDNRGKHHIDCGFRRSVEGDTTMTGFHLHHQYQPDSMRVVASATWPDEGSLQMTWRFVETAFCDTVTCEFDGDRLRMKRRVNTNPGEMERPTISGFLAQ
jgi:CubicO group peptidase (beta-lactamase class C family)